MDRTAQFFQHQNTTLHYSVSGTGSKTLLCFHGFGLTGQSFYELEESLSNEYTSTLR